MIYNLITFYIAGKKYKNVALGTFDGVHLGHQKLISTLAKNDDQNLVITFNNKKSLYTVDQKAKLINEVASNIDVLSIDLSLEIKQTTKDKFINFLNQVGIKKIYVGKDYRFGYKQEGSIKDLTEYFEVDLVSFYEVDNKKVSSRTIKQHLIEGEVSKANELLGKKYTLNGISQKGNQLGTTINFPTINIYLKNTFLKYGVYKTKITILNKTYESITNVGITPTVTDDRELKIETNILEYISFDGYDKEVEIIFENFVRPEQKFNGLDQLKEQIKKDIKIVKGEL